MTALKSGTVVFLLLSLLLRGVAAVPSSWARFIQLSSAAYPALSLRHCSLKAYATRQVSGNANFVWEVAPAYDGSSGSAYFSLRSANWAGLYLCMDSSANLGLMTPSSASSCTFEAVSGLSDSNLYSVKISGYYLTSLGTLSGSCASDFASPESLVGLTSDASNSPKLATWMVQDASTFRLVLASNTTVSLRHCGKSSVAATYSKSSVGSFTFYWTAALDGSTNVESVSLRSTNNPDLYYGIGSGSIPGAVTCAGRESYCTWVRSSTYGSMTLLNAATSRYLALSDTGTASCTTFLKYGIVSTTAESWSIVPYATGTVVGSATVDGSQVLKNVSQALWGITFEEVNFAGDGGLYAEMVRNGDFEACGRGNLGNSSTPISSLKDVTDYRPWVVQVQKGNATVSTGTMYQPFASNPVSLMANLSAGAMVLFKNTGYWNMGCTKSQAYSGSIYMRSEGSVNVTIRLMTPSMSAVLTNVAKIAVNSTSWVQYTYTLTATTTAASMLVIRFETPIDGALMWMDQVSLKPAQAVSGLFTPLLYNAISALKPSFLRFPGGSYLKGDSWDTRWNWKNTLTSAENRTGHYNVAWGYWNTDDLGLYEYLVLCESLGTQSVLMVFSGSTSSGYVDESLVSNVTQEALDELEFIVGATSTTYGAMREKMGHAAAFAMPQVQIGYQETNAARYLSAFEAIAGALQEKYPSIVIIADGEIGTGTSSGSNPCTSGMTCGMWDKEYFMTPGGMAGAGDVFDTYSRSGTKALVGAFAANSTGAQTIQTAVAEGVFMMGMEQNGDAVAQASFSTLLGNVGGTQKGFVEINFNGSQTAMNPVYYVQQLMAESQCAQTVKAGHAGNVSAVSACTTESGMAVRLANYQDASVLLTLALSNLSNISTTGIMSVVTGPAWWAVNAVGGADFVGITTRTIAVSSRFRVVLPGWSFAVITFAATPGLSGSGDGSEAGNDSCNKHSICRTCLMDSDCGWCGSTSTCITSSDETAPSTCGSDWEYGSCSASTDDASGTASVPWVIIVAAGGGGVIFVCVTAVTVAMIVKRKQKRWINTNIPIEDGANSLAFVPAPTCGYSSGNSGGFNMSGSSDSGFGYQLDGIVPVMTANGSLSSADYALNGHQRNGSQQQLLQGPQVVVLPVVYSSVVPATGGSSISTADFDVIPPPITDDVDPPLPPIPRAAQKPQPPEHPKLKAAQAKPAAKPGPPPLPQKPQPPVKAKALPPTPPQRMQAGSSPKNRNVPPSPPRPNASGKTLPPPPLPPRK